MRNKVPTRVTSVRLPVSTLDAVKGYCEEHGLILGTFFDEAIRTELDRRQNPEANNALTLLKLRQIQTLLYRLLGDVRR